MDMHILDRKTQDMLWACLGKEVRDSLRRQYSRWGASVRSVVGGIFNWSNLTSEQEPSDLLCVKKELVEKKRKDMEWANSKTDNEWCKGYLQALHDMFGNENVITPSNKYVCDDTELLVLDKFVKTLTEATRKRKVFWNYKESSKSFHPRIYKEGGKDNLAEKFHFCVSVMGTSEKAFTIWVCGTPIAILIYDEHPIHNDLMALYHAVRESIEDSEAFIQLMIEDLDKL